MAGVVRRTDGVVSMAPNLGWRDEPARRPPRRGASASASRSRVANEADLGVLAETRRGAARGADQVLYLSGEVGVGGGHPRRRPSRSPGSPATAARSATSRSTRTAVACGCGSIGCWETEVGAAALLRRAGRPRGRPAGGGRGGPPGRARRATPSPSPRSRRSAGGPGRGLAGLVNVLNPRLVVFGGLFGRLFPFIGAEPSWRSSIGWRSARRATSSASSRPRSARMRPSWAPPSIAFEPFLADPARWLRRRHGILERASA